MLLDLWLTIKSKLFLLGSVMVTLLALVARFQFVKNARDRAELEADTLKATAHAHRIKRKIQKEEEEELSRREIIIKEKLKKRGKEFEGLDNLSDSNDY